LFQKRGDSGNGGHGDFSGNVGVVEPAQVTLTSVERLVSRADVVRLCLTPAVVSL
jgi:hypothetical protein